LKWSAREYALDTRQANHLGKTVDMAKDKKDVLFVIFS
jgi:hypothetical protein